MAHKVTLPVLVICMLALPGCVASMAASAVGAAVRSAQSQQEANRVPLDSQVAVTACTEHAAQHGTASIIDVEDRGRVLIVWGTVSSHQERRSFECRYNGKIAHFKLRQLPTR